MLENRPIVNIVIGYIIGILMGLYFKISIVLLYLIIALILYLYPKSIKKTKFKLISIKRYLRYIKIIFTKKVLFIIIITSIISNTITLYQNSKFNNLYKNLENQELIIKAEIVSNKKQKQYKEVYKIKVENINGNKKYKNTYLYLNTKQEINLEYGNKIIFKGEYKEPAKRTNYKGFDYKEYLKTLKINGIVQSNEILQIEPPSKTILKLSNEISLKIKEKIKNNFSEETGNLLLGLTIGDIENLDEQIKENFKNCNLLHILSISGMHIAYIIIFTNFVFIKILGKRIGKIITFFIIII